MAKKQTFGDKTGKSSGKSKSMIKLVKTEKSKSGFLRFKEVMVAIPDGQNVNSVIKDLTSK
tara:strand:- start:261 stop:443 length:183 start_codon:yes stop_codon:yes gene_type:complete